MMFWDDNLAVVYKDSMSFCLGTKQMCILCKKHLEMRCCNLLVTTVFCPEIKLIAFSRETSLKIIQGKGGCREIPNVSKFKVVHPFVRRRRCTVNSEKMRDWSPLIHMLFPILPQLKLREMGYKSKEANKTLLIDQIIARSQL